MKRLSGFTYDPDAKDFSQEHAKELMVRYQKYDWRLKRVEEDRSLTLTSANTSLTDLVQYGVARSPPVSLSALP